MASLAARAEMLEEAERLERQAEVLQRCARDLRGRAEHLSDGMLTAVDWVHFGIWEAAPAVAVRDATRDSRHDVEAGTEDLLDVAHHLDREADDLRDEARHLRRKAEQDDSPFGFLGL